MKILLNRADKKEEYVNTSTIYRYKKISGYLSKRKGQNKIQYCPLFISLDTETSHNHDEKNPVGWVYQWAFEFNGQCVVGRTPTRLCTVLAYIKKKHYLSYDRRVVVYVHNLSYDITYLYKFLMCEFNEEPEVLALDSHKILTFYIGGFEFRCSYLLTNMSVEKAGEQLKTEYRKCVGAIDYDVIRYQDTPLDYNDWYYQVNDVYTLKAIIETELSNNSDNICTIPLTSTSYVRRDCRKAVHNKEYRKFFIDTQLNETTYKLCRQAFAGGYVHANRFITGQTLKDKNFRHKDFKSHYPARQLLNYFPTTKFIKYSEFDDNVTISEYKKLCNEYCVIANVIFKDIHLKSERIAAPYLQHSKILNTKDYKSLLFNGKKGDDNGRILITRGYTNVTITELDFKIIDSQYEWSEIYFNDVYIAERGDFPKEIQEVILDYFYKKENLPKDSYFYMKSKNKLNAIYGMTATDIVRNIVTMSFEKNSFTIEKPDDISAALDKYYSSRNSFMPYQLGVYTTAWARYELFKLIQIVGYENFLYCDTDSIFYISNEEIEKKIEDYNNSVIERAKEREAYVSNRNGGISYLGTFEDENDDIKEFRTLHSKCYVTVDGNNQMHCTIAGVNKKLCGEELKTIDNLRDGFVFVKAGGTRSVYTRDNIGIYEHNGHKIEYATACILFNTTKTMSGLCEEYEIYDYE